MRVSLGAHVSGRNVRALSVGVNRESFGSQAFAASAFNANIGAWNTASVSRSNMVNVSAGRDLGRRAQRGGALSRLLFDAARPLCAVALPMRV